MQNIILYLALADDVAERCFQVRKIGRITQTASVGIRDTGLATVGYLWFLGPTLLERKTLLLVACLLMILRSTERRW